MELSKKYTIYILVVVLIFYLSFMILDRLLSIIYGFNFQPFGPSMPPGFSIWGHLFNGSLAAFALYLVFKAYDHWDKKRRNILKFLPIFIFFVVGALVPYMNDFSYLVENGVGNTVFAYVIFNDIYLFLVGFFTFKKSNTLKKKIIMLISLFIIFVVVHFFYTQSFPEFYWI